MYMIIENKLYNHRLKIFLYEGCHLNVSKCVRGGNPRGPPPPPPPLFLYEPLHVYGG